MNLESIHSNFQRDWDGPEKSRYSLVCVLGIFINTSVSGIFLKTTYLLRLLTLQKLMVFAWWNDICTEMLSNLLYFWNMKTYIDNFFYSVLCALFFSLMNVLVYVFQHNPRTFILGKFWSILLSHFFKYKPLISKEWQD